MLVLGFLESSLFQVRLPHPHSPRGLCLTAVAPRHGASSCNSRPDHACPGASTWRRRQRARGCLRRRLPFARRSHGLACRAVSNLGSNLLSHSSFAFVENRSRHVESDIEFRMCFFCSNINPRLECHLLSPLVKHPRYQTI